MPDKEKNVKQSMAREWLCLSIFVAPHRAQMISKFALVFRLGSLQPKKSTLQGLFLYCFIRG